MNNTNIKESLKDIVARLEVVYQDSTLGDIKDIQQDIINMSQKLYVNYPVAKTYEEAKQAFVDGFELWQEISDDYPECTMIESVEDLNEILDVVEDDVDSNMDISDYFIHLVK